MIISSLLSALTSHPEKIQTALDHQKMSDSFIYLNTACMQDGAFIFFPDDCHLDKPLHLIFISTSNANDCMQHTRNIIMLGKGARVTIIEEYQSFTDAIFFHNSVNQVHTGESSELEWITLQNQHLNAFFISTTLIYQQKTSCVNYHTYHLGSQLARETVHCFLEGEESSVRLQGLYLPLNRQHIDLHTYIYHQADHTLSEEFFNGAVANRSRAVFNGKVIVDTNTHKTSANLQNKNLILTADCEVNTKPELEIYSDDLKCRHGATVGQIDQEMLFYLCSRGIAKEQAYLLLMLAFVGEHLEKISHQNIIDRIKQLVVRHCEEHL